MTQTKVTDAMRDTTSLDVSDLSGAVPVAKGGTGVTAVGTSGNVLTSNGSAWASTAPAGGGLAHFYVTSSGTITIANNTYTKITLDTEIRDTESIFDATTNYRVVIPNGEVWLLMGDVYYLDGVSARYRVLLKKNNSSYEKYGASGVSAAEVSASVWHVVTGNGTDYYELFTQHNSGSTQNLFEDSTSFLGVKLA